MSEQQPREPAAYLTDLYYAAALLEQGLPNAAVHAKLVERGCQPRAADAILDELLSRPAPAPANLPDTPNSPPSNPTRRAGFFSALSAASRVRYLGALKTAAGVGGLVLLMLWFQWMREQKHANAANPHKTGLSFIAGIGFGFMAAVLALHGWLELLTGWEFRTIGRNMREADRKSGDRNAILLGVGLAIYAIVAVGSLLLIADLGGGSPLELAGIIVLGLIGWRVIFRV